jgi:hypothetical protein
VKLQSRLFSGKLYNYYYKAINHTICGDSIFYDLIRADNCVMVLSHDIVEDEYGIRHDVEILNCDGTTGKIVSRHDVSQLFKLIEH